LPTLLTQKLKKMNQFTEENQDKLAKGLGIVLTFAAQQTKTGQDNLIIAKVQEAINGINLEDNVDEQELIAAIFDIAEVVTSLTKTQVDDATVSAGRALLSGGNGGLIGLIKGAIQISKAHKEDKKAGN